MVYKRYGITYSCGTEEKIMRDLEEEELHKGAVKVHGKWLTKKQLNALRKHRGG